MGMLDTPAGEMDPVDFAVLPRFTRNSLLSFPKDRIPDSEMLPQSAYQIVHDEVMLDGNARFNLATFVTTWMDDEADRLYAETADKNMVDKDEYPQTADIEARCVRMLADLWNAPDVDDAIGTSTTGSSEGCMLGGLALKRRWQHARTAAGLSTDRPNLVMGQNVQVVWEKFAEYWDVEPRYVPLTDDALYLTPDRMLPYVDENTIGVVAILGSTMEGSYEPVAEICAALDDLEARTGLSVPVHVDAASGGFVAPFLQPDLAWDFRLPRVASIQSSGHKYGLVYPGVGWVLWRQTANLPEELVFKVNYLGGNMPTFALNFSRPGAQVLLQYFQFLRLGREGYRRVQQTCQDVAVHLSDAIAARPEFELVSDGRDLPVFAFTMSSTVANYTAYDVSRKLRERGWLVPAYTMPPNREELVVLRIVVRNGFSHDMAELFLRDLGAACEWLNDLEGPMPAERAPEVFHH
jgi:glutamate decarboxylase